MYSNKDHVNILTALLVEHGICHAVVCPGSRNAPIVHNLNECPDINCYPVTDERSAGFFALGIAQATDQPVVVCVTSGTALLNLAPAVAEAHYQHQSLIIISADRPARWIDQLDGQTLRQPGALRPWVAGTFSLPEDDKWHSNRMVNEALMKATTDCRPCVHINVPISEPLFQFTVATLPAERMIRLYAPDSGYHALPQALIDDMLQAERPLIVFGQLSPRRFHYEGMDYLFSHIIVLHESLAPMTSVSHFDEVLETPRPELQPDVILYVGDAIVSKRLKHFLRQASDARTWRISLTGQVEDTFQNLNGLIVGDAEVLLQALSDRLSNHTVNSSAAEYRRKWLHLLSEARKLSEATALPFSEGAAVREFERQLQQADYAFDVHYANSMPIRLANRYAQGHPVWCNRGVNGIEGSLSTAAGFSAVARTLSSSMVFCVIGDLSFFYDQNALWNQNLGGNFRILLLNNGRGAIFDQLPGLENSPACHTFIAGAHATTAEGICRQNGVDYFRAENAGQLQQGIAWLLVPHAVRPMLLEVIFS